MPKVFIAYARHDKETVARIVRDLRNLRLDVYWDEDLKSGKWSEQLGREIRKADHFIWMMSPVSVKSTEVAREYGAASEAGAECHVLDIGGGVAHRDAPNEVANQNWWPLDRLIEFGVSISGLDTVVARTQERIRRGVFLSIGLSIFAVALVFGSITIAAPTLIMGERGEKGDRGSRGDSVTTAKEIAGTLRGDSKFIAEMGVVPVGSVFVWVGDEGDLPDNWAVCRGQSFEEDWDKDELQRVLRNRYGMHQIPDLRGYFLRGIDNRQAIAHGIDPDRPRALGSPQGHQFESHSHSGSYTDKHVKPFPPGTAKDIEYSEGTGRIGFSDRATTVIVEEPTGNAGPETRPINIGVHWIIRVN